MDFMDSFIDNYTFRQKKEVDEENTNLKQIVCFNLFEQVYGIDIENVIEVITRPNDITSLINTPEFIVGVLNLRGEIIPIFDLKSFFEIDAVDINKSENIIIVRDNVKIAGLLVDKILEIKKISQLTNDTLPATVSIKIATYLKGVVNDNGIPISVINISNIFEAEEIKQFE